MQYGRSAIALLAALAAASIATIPASAADGISGVTWRVVDLHNGPVPADVVADLMIEADGAAAGRAGCNRFVAHATIEGDAITFSPSANTRMLCAEAAMNVEKSFLAVLASAHRFSLDRDAGELFLHDASGSTLARLKEQVEQ